MQRIARSFAMCTVVLPLSLALAACVPKLPHTNRAETGKHVTDLRIGTGFDSSTGKVKGQDDTFRVGTTITVVATVDTADTTAQVVLQIRHGGTVEDTSLPLEIQSGKHAYAKTVDLAMPGGYTVVVQYDSADEARLDFTVK